MTLTIAQMNINEKWMLETIQSIKPGGFWMWQDYGVIFFVNSKNQFICENQKKYNMISKLVRPMFLTLCVEKTF